MIWSGDDLTGADLTWGRFDLLPSVRVKHEMVSPFILKQYLLNSTSISREHKKSVTKMVVPFISARKIPYDYTTLFRPLFFLETE
jgi:hypothetical protein